MTWQDELRRLEDDLAGGRVSAEDYRIRRDQLLSSANASPPPDTSMDNTQIIPPVQDTGADATQVVNRQQSAQGYAQQPHQGGYQQSYQRPYQQQAPQPGHPGTFDQPPQDDNEPPWAGNEFPPLGAGSSGWVKQGPEVSGGKTGTKGKLIGIISGVVLVVILGVGAWLLFGQGSGQQHPQAHGGKQDTQHGQPAPPKKKANPLGIIDPKGDPERHDDVKTLQALQKANYLTPQEEQAYKNALTSKLVFKVSHDAGATIVLVGAKASSPDSAKKAANALNDAQLSSGMKPAAGDQPKGVYVAQLKGKSGQKSELRAHYAHGTTIVRVHVYGKDSHAVQQDFQQTLNDQLGKLSADG